MNYTFYGCATITGGQRSTLSINLANFQSKQNVPGPGSYEPVLKDKQQIPKWTMKPRVENMSCFHNPNAQVPGAGAYTIPSSFSPIKKTKIQKNQKTSSRIFSTKSSPRLQLQLPSFVDKKGGFSFGYRESPIQTETSPGPVYYVDNIYDEKRSTKNYQKLNGFGSSPKLGGKLNPSLEPGPGSYEYTKNVQKSGWSFSKSQKKPVKTSQNPIGPGEYNIYLKYDKSAPKIKGKYSPPKPVDYDAAPGSYDIPDTKSKRGAIIKARSSSNPRPSEFEEHNENEEDPSPFTYDANVSTLKKGGFTLGKKINYTDRNSWTPGPGAYEISEKVEEKVGGYMSRKFETKKKISQSQDNFYKYTPKIDYTTYKSPHYTFGAPQTAHSESNPGLGPGRYYILQKGKGEAYSFGKGPRFHTPNHSKPRGESLARKDYYSSFGYLPSYLKTKTKRQMKTQQSQRMNRSTPDVKN